MGGEERGREGGTENWEKMRKEWAKKIKKNREMYVRNETGEKREGGGE